jgi:ribosomal-protein-alanine N-acetyltransferase
LRVAARQPWRFPWTLWRPASRESAPETLELLGERVLLRPLRMGDVEALFQCARDPEVTKYLPWYPATGLDSVESFLGDQIGRRKRGESLGMGLCLRETGEMVGSVDLMSLRTAKKTGEGEIGYLVRRDCWGRGLMGEAAALARDYAFRQYDLRLLIGFADAENLASRRVLEKLGMCAEDSETRTVKNEERLYIRYELPRVRWESQL